MDEIKLESIKSAIRIIYDLGSKYGKYDIYNDETFEMLISEFLTFYKFISLNDDEKIQIKKAIDSEFLIYQKDGTAILEDYEHIQDWYTSRKNEIEERYWSRYRSHLFNKKWSINVLNKLEYDTLDNLMNLIGDPFSAEGYSRRGLVMGDVQSGKTSNYIGLMCKAADAGYKVIILLTGVLESLRIQTQIRVEEGFIGYDTENSKWVGVGENRQEDYIIPKSLTSRARDFTGTTGENTLLKIDGDKAPFVFITKKNVNTLKKIRESLTNINIHPPKKAINTSLLIVDDEADNASINTNDSKYDPTKINSEIRKLLNLFTKSTYVGFTATPFANVFIDPETEDEMLKGDLFPKDFIYSLNPPSNYFGSDAMFIENRYNVVQLIEDGDEGFPVNHKKDWNGDTLFESLYEAIDCFLLVNAIRDYNEKSLKTTHRTMLINMSRFIKVQEKITEIVSNRLNNILNAIRYNHKLDINSALQNPYIKNMKVAFDKHYGNYASWENVFSCLYEATKNIQVYKVPNKTSDPNYEKNNKIGLRCIVVGGLALSRGLTLEGLTISYLYRNTATFDVLMQMGRWFGYRDKPIDYSYLCKVWMLETTRKYFEQITISIRELKSDIEQMKKSKKTPSEFGVRVRNESDKLGITARSKMRSTKKYIHFEDFFGKVLETPFIDSKSNVLKNNMRIVSNLLEGLVYEDYNGKFLYRNVPKERIVGFLKSFDIHDANKITYFEVESITQFIEDNNYKNFDIILQSVNKGESVIFNNIELKPLERQFDLLLNSVIRVSRKHRRLGGSGDTKMPNQATIEKARSSMYMTEDRNPILMIYPLALKKIDETDKKNEYLSMEEIQEINNLVDCYNSNQIIPFGIGIGFPSSSTHYMGKKKTYYVNFQTDWWNIMNAKDNEEDE